MWGRICSLWRQLPHYLVEHDNKIIYSSELQFLPTMKMKEEVQFMILRGNTQAAVYANP